MDEPLPPAAPQGSPRSSRRFGGILPWIVTAVILVGVVLLVRQFAATGSGKRTAAVPPAAVSVATIATADMQVVNAGLGTVTSLASVIVQPQISGVLQVVGFKEGQIVHKGDFLAQIDPRPTQALLEQARGTLAHDQGVLRQAETDAKRYALLNRQDSIGRQQYEDQQFVVQQEQGQIAADQGAIQTQMVNLSYCRIVSPVDGRVGLRQVDAGNYVTSSLANGIVVVTQLDPISVIFTLPEDDVPAIQKEIGAGNTLQVIAYDRSNTIQLGTGIMETLDNQIDTTTGTVKLRALFANPGNMLFPNQFVNARLIVSTIKGAVTAPNAAIQTGAPGSFVYAVQQDDTVVVKPVKLGVADADKTQIVSGVSVGDRVVTDGADRLRAGAKVKIPGDHPADDAVAPAQHKHRRKADGDR